MTEPVARCSTSVTSAGHPPHDVPALSAGILTPTELADIAASRSAAIASQERRPRPRTSAAAG